MSITFAFAYGLLEMLMFAVLTAASLFTTGPLARVPQTSQARVAEIYQPSRPHRELARLVGTWEQKTVFATGATPVTATGRVVNRSTLGGRFIVSEGSATRAPSFDYTSLLVFGFDGRTREHTVVVFDSFGTYYVEARRPFTPDPAPSLTMSGETREGASRKQFDVVLTWIDADTYRLDIVFRFPDRPPVVAVSSTCIRVKGADPVELGGSTTSR